MRYLLFFFALATLPLLAEDEFKPAISIESPDTATTFAFGLIKNRSLVWSESKKILLAQVTFQEPDGTSLTGNDDTHDFRLPGISFDKAKQIYFATTATGEVIPIARRKKSFPFSTIEILPNAIVRVHHPHGVVSVTLEAIRPSDLARVQKEQEGSGSPDGTHTINIQDLLP